MNVVGHLVNGERCTDTGRTGDIYNPAIGTVARQVAMASEPLVNQAVEAAQAAYPEWRDTPPARRAQFMFRFKTLLEQNSDEICLVIGDEHGKILHDATGEFKLGIENVEYACFAPELLKGEHSRNVGPNVDSWSEFHPLGVVVGITPFNFPAMVPLWMYPLAIVCGNTFVLKPSEKDPTAALLVAELLYEAGLPPGVLNIVNGDKEAVDGLLRHDQVQAVSFVGSTAVAEYIYNTATSHGKRCQALGGAKNHAVIMPDADLDNAVSALTGAAFGSAGERCMALSVVVCVGDEVADAFVARMSGAMKSLRVGACGDEFNDFGPLITRQHKEKVVGYINSAEEQGAAIVVDGRDCEVAGFENGFFIGGTLIDRVTPGMTCHEEEIFGPVLLVMRVADMEQAMQVVNNHEYGNGTCIFTRDGEAARYFSDKVLTGMVGINIPLPVPVGYHSFGGWKRSLFGDLHAYGPDGVRFYTRRKTITQRWPSADVREGAHFSFP